MDTTFLHEAMIDAIQLIDIRRSKEAFGATPQIRSQIIDGLSKPSSRRTLPPELLYDEVGLKIYNEQLKDWSKWYYPTLAETEILQLYGAEIATQFHQSKTGKAVLIELGAGSLEKTAYILLALASLVPFVESDPPITYYALDLDKKELERTLTNLQEKYGDRLSGKIATKGLWGTYDDGIRALEQNELKLDNDIPMHLLFLGGTIGNFTRGEDAKFLRGLPLRRQAGDTLTMGIDRAKSVEALEFAYGFEAATPWIMNGLRSAGIALCEKDDFFSLADWERYKKFNETRGRYEAGYRAKKRLPIRLPESDQVVEIEEGEVILVMFSNKYTDGEIEALLKAAGLQKAHIWSDKKEQYYLLSASPTDVA